MRYIILLFVIFVGAMVWRAAQVLNADALGVIIGIGLGLVMQVPGLLLMLADRRRGPQQVEHTRERIVYVEAPWPGRNGGSLEETYFIDGDGEDT